MRQNRIYSEKRTIKADFVRDSFTLEEKAILGLRNVVLPSRYSRFFHPSMFSHIMEEEEEAWLRLEREREMGVSPFPLLGRNGIMGKRG